MSYVVQEPCVDCKFGDCIEVCPVDAFHEDETMLVINPETCIDCDQCVAACPVAAIFSGDEAAPDWAQRNADFDFTDENQRFGDQGKDSVTHGPKCDRD